MRRFSTGTVTALAVLVCGVTLEAGAGERMDRYYAHETLEDQDGVIAPWYRGQNGQFDWRVRIAAETLKRYPWTKPGEAVAVAPHYFYNGAWGIAPDGTISIPELNDWNNGDQSQRIAFILSALVDYYRYAGDAAAIGIMQVVGDRHLAHCLTAEDHPWPSFPISVPVEGTPYGNCDPDGYMQTDIAAEVGLALLKAYQVTGEERWFDAAKHWGDLFAAYEGTGPGNTPWSRYANPEAVPWSDLMTGGVTYILFFLDELIRLGYAGPEDTIVKARDAGAAYLRDRLLPEWTRQDVWGRNFWDWECFVQCEYVTTFACRYLMANPDTFLNWRNDARNIMNLFLNHTSVSRSSSANVYSGAWAYPESAGCCLRSLWYPPMEVSTVYAEYGARADSEWAKEMARRQQILATYGELENGVVEDNIDGGQIVAGSWFKITHPMALKHILGTMAWLPEAMGANRENHIMRSTAVVKHVVYDDGAVRYTTFDAPGDTSEVLRLAFTPSRVTADGAALERRDDLGANGYTVKDLPGGDCIVGVRHDGATYVSVEGEDPQQVADEAAMTLEGDWQTIQDPAAHGGALISTSAEGAAVTFPFNGNQVRLVGRFGPDGGMADVYLDGEKQLAPIDCWNPTVRDQQVLYYRNGLENGAHELMVVARGAGNPIAPGRTVYIDAAQRSDATGDGGFGAGGGPTSVQRMVFGYAGREPLVDERGHAWHNGVEYIVRLADMVDSVAQSWWTEPRAERIEGTPDPELYRYGAHGPRLLVNLTVGPGTYYARIKLAETRDVEPVQRALDIGINGDSRLRGLDIAATAGGLNRAMDLVFGGIQPKHGVIEIELCGQPGGEAILQALEVGPGDGGQGAEPVCLPEDVLVQEVGQLVNGGFEYGTFSTFGSKGHRAKAGFWEAEVLSESTSYIWAESASLTHPGWGMPVYHSGSQALRTHMDGRGHTRIWQVVEVEPSTPYEATAWVHGFSQHGKGFGTHEGDSAGIVLEELDVDGHVVATHPKAAVTEATDGYQQVKAVIATSPATRRLRFVLDTIIHAHYADGHVTYDDCELRSMDTTEGAQAQGAHPEPVTVLVDADAPWMVRHAAEELAAYLHRMVPEAQVSVATDLLASVAAWYLVAESGQGDLWPRTGDASSLSWPGFAEWEDGFAIRSTEHHGTPGIVIAGANPKGVLNGVYHYLEYVCGVGFFPDGEQVPRLKALPVTGFDIEEHPRFRYRANLPLNWGIGLRDYFCRMWALEDWQRHLDWMAKKKLNVLTLYIEAVDKFWGTAFAEAFPEVREHGWPRPEDFRVYPPDIRTNLMKEVYTYARARGIRVEPVFFYGAVEETYKLAHPTLEYHKGTYAPDNWYISAHQPECADAMERLWRAYNETFGTDHLYRLDLVMEDKPTGADSRDMYRQAREALLRVDPKAEVISHWNYAWNPPMASCTFLESAQDTATAGHPAVTVEDWVDMVQCHPDANTVLNKAGVPKWSAIYWNTGWDVDKYGSGYSALITLLHLQGEDPGFVGFYAAAGDLSPVINPFTADLMCQMSWQPSRVTSASDFARGYAVRRHGAEAGRDPGVLASYDKMIEAGELYLRKTMAYNQGTGNAIAYGTLPNNLWTAFNLVDAGDTRASMSVLDEAIAVLPAREPLRSAPFLLEHRHKLAVTRLFEEVALNHLAALMGETREGQLAAVDAAIRSATAELWLLIGRGGRSIREDIDELRAEGMPIQDIAAAGTPSWHWLMGYDSVETLELSRLVLLRQLRQQIETGEPVKMPWEVWKDTGVVVPQ